MDIKPLPPSFRGIYNLPTSDYYYYLGLPKIRVGGARTTKN